MTRDKKILRASILTAYVFIGLYILFYSAKIYKLRDFSGMYFLFSLSLLNNISLLTFLLADDRKVFLDHSSLEVLFSLWILLDYIFLYRYKINFKYTSEVSLSFIYLLIFYNFYIFLSRVKELKWKYFNYFALIIFLLTFISNYLNSTFYMGIVKFSRLFIAVFPLILVLTYRKEIKKYSHKLLSNVWLISLIYLFLFILMNFLKVFTYVYLREFIILFVAELSILIFIVSMDKNLKKIIFDFYRNPINFIFIFIFTLFFESFVKNYRLSLLFAMIFSLNMANIKLIMKFRKITNNKSAYEKFLYNNKLAKNLSENFERRSLSFLHDDILQDIILSKKFLEDEKNMSKSLETHKSLIKKIRLKINLIEPAFREGISHYEIYRELINSLKEMYQDDKLLEFYCDKNIFLTSPYDKVIYNFIHEMVTNFYKHSQGYFSELRLEIEDGIIFLTIKNFEDFLDEDFNRKNHSGISFMEETLKIYGGDLILKNKIEKDSKDQTYVEFIIKLPIQEEIVNENFINRRS
ncbi:hypothetical protein [Peptoniphilus sp. HMSC062D09]|uniref:hypothetical protein n=1 Tax=Peptoniphilus TaxID=162289 RepID=UPI0008A33283|nr:hypothetical protein [Peptoniphilus sp. HMSC062D09]OFK78105.1 hypothetical protein HMPREF2801_01455 [Peptoniphilus sp. HMSC062D09]